MIGVIPKIQESNILKIGEFINPYFKEYNQSMVFSECANIKHLYKNVKDLFRFCMELFNKNLQLIPHSPLKIPPNADSGKNFKNNFQL